MNDAWSGLVELLLASLNRSLNVVVVSVNPASSMFANASDMQTTA
jgi:hypothetical protein